MFSDKQLKDMILPLLMEYPDLSDNTTAHKNFCGFGSDHLAGCHLIQRI